MIVKFHPGPCAAYLHVQYNSQNDIWVWYSKEKGALCTHKFLHEEHPIIQKEITEHFDKVFNMSLPERALFMYTARSWIKEIPDAS